MKQTIKIDMFTNHSPLTNKQSNIILLGYGVTDNENISHMTIPNDQTSD